MAFEKALFSRAPFWLKRFFICNRLIFVFVITNLILRYKRALFDIFLLYFVHGSMPFFYIDWRSLLVAWVLLIFKIFISIFVFSPTYHRWDIYWSSIVHHVSIYHENSCIFFYPRNFSKINERNSTRSIQVVQEAPGQRGPWEQKRTGGRGSLTLWTFTNMYAQYL